jgi:hypothetical protein
LTYPIVRLRKVVKLYVAVELEEEWGLGWKKLVEAA